MRLSEPVTIIEYVSKTYANRLKRLGIETIQDLITHFPRRYEDASEITDIADIAKEDKYVIRAFPKSVANIRIRGGRTMQSAMLSDNSGSIKVTWFNQPWLEKQLNSNKEYLFSGKAKHYRGSMSFFANSFEEIKAGGEQVHLGRIAPVYALTEGVSANWLRKKLKLILDNLDLAAELLQLETELQKKLPQEFGELELLQSIKQVHFPDSETSLESARETLQLMELINLQLQVINQQKSKKKYPAPKLKIDGQLVESFVSELPFQLTADQQTSVSDIMSELQTTNPMNRLLQGDVGTGKTIVAVVAALATVRAGHQAIVLAPTTILAEQHYENFKNYLDKYDIQISLITGNTKSETGQILIGTSAILARKQNLIAKPGLVVVDEQHRFGVKQREELLSPILKNTSAQLPHLLTMTATPIPRSLALALFAEIEVSSIRTKPKGRLPIKTFVVPESKRDDSYAWLENKIYENGEQVFWVCPLIEESETMEIKSAKETYNYLSTQVFPNLRIGLLHGKLKPQEKLEIMTQFANHELDILVSTSVIEVGIDVPNATVMVIEGAERFGMAQLHQIRGRVGRNDKQSWCFLFPSSDVSELAMERLVFFSEHTDGLEIAEYDLQRRGPGEVYGTRQSGVPNLKIANILNIPMLKQSRVLGEKLYKAGSREILLFS